jgi:hypothetical protein
MNKKLKNKWRLQMDKKITRRKKALAAVALLSIPCLTLPQLTGFAEGSYMLDPEEASYSLTIYLPGEEEGGFPELQEQEFTVQAYRVADMKNADYYEPAKGLEALDLDSLDENTKASEWEERIQFLTGALGLTEDEKSEAKKVSLTPEEITIKNGSGSAEDLEPGLYLIWTDAVDTTENEYTFMPSLIQIPNKTSKESKVWWNYDAEVNLKPARADRLGEIVIEKELKTYNASLGAASFIFQVDATKEDELVYSDVVSLDFSKPGKQSVVVDQIPGGSKVTVKEIYSGASYQLVQGTNGEYTLTMEPNEDGDLSQTVAFTNDYNYKQTSGTSVVNHFAYDEENSGWQWKKITTSAASETEAEQETVNGEE